MLTRILVAFLVVLKIVGGVKYSTGESADKLCKAYKKICPTGKICVIQNLYWPRKMSFPVCVHQRDVPIKAKICELPPSPGGCGARFRRWYFNVHTMECSPLTYSGCEGNLNNFHTKEKCERICEGTSKTSDEIEELAPKIVSMGITSRTPAVLAAPAPLQIQSTDMREALELKGDAPEIDLNRGSKLRRRKHRRGGRRNPNGKRRRRRRHRKHRKPSFGRFAELRGRKTSIILPPAQSDQEPQFLLRQLRRKQRRLARARQYGGYDGYYDRIRLFSLLGKGNKRRSEV